MCYLVARPIRCVLLGSGRVCDFDVTPTFGG
jgi:hypothetical protein